MTSAYPAQTAEYAPSCDAVTMPTPDSMISVFEDATAMRGSNPLTHEEAANEVMRHRAKAR